MISDITKKLLKGDLLSHLKAAACPEASAAARCFHDGHIDGLLRVVKELSHDMPELGQLVDELERIRVSSVQLGAPDEENMIRK